MQPPSSVFRGRDGLLGIGLSSVERPARVSLQNHVWSSNVPEGYGSNDGRTSACTVISSVKKLH